ncbi:MAG: LptF/LptG family permease [Bacteroidota bacterium]
MTKRIDWLVFRAFLGPFAVSLLVILFILVMQFMSLYMNEITNKGLPPEVFGKLFFYASGRLVLTALPVALMAGALMAFGNMGEHNELAAIKSCGISLLKIMRSVMWVSVLLTAFSLWVSFDIIPQANLKFFSLLYDVQRKKPDVAIKPGHFYSDIDGYVIRVSDKDNQSGTLYDIRIYNHTENRGNNDVVVADSARMTLQNGVLRMTLYQGIRYEDYRAENEKPNNKPHGRTYFDSLYYRFPLEGFDLSRTDESLFRHQITLTYDKLVDAIDSLDVVERNYVRKATKQLGRYNKVDSSFFYYTRDTLGTLSTLIAKKMEPEDNILLCYEMEYPEEAVGRAITNARAIKSYTEFMIKKQEDQQKAENRYNYEFHFRYALPFNCMVFILIGIAFGAIIRKGGLGPSALISLTLFMAFYILTTYGKKFAKEGVIAPWLGAWLSVIVFAPLALILIYQATMDAKLLSESFWASIRDRMYENRFLRPIAFVLYDSPLTTVFSWIGRNGMMLGFLLRLLANVFTLPVGILIVPYVVWDPDRGQEARTESKRRRLRPFRWLKQKLTANPSASEESAPGAPPQTEPVQAQESDWQQVKKSWNLLVLRSLGKKPKKDSEEG